MVIERILFSLVKVSSNVRCNLRVRNFDYNILLFVRRGGLKIFEEIRNFHRHYSARKEGEQVSNLIRIINMQIGKRSNRD